MNDEMITAMRQVRPAGPPEDPAVRERAWARLRAELDTPPEPRRVLGRRIAWRSAIIGAVAAGAAAAVIVTQAGGNAPGTPRAGGTGQTVRILEVAAKTVENQTAPGRGQTSGSMSRGSRLSTLRGPRTGSGRWSSGGGSTVRRPRATTPGRMS
ncbi:hypothetical protein F8566_00780 [Actinomadura rudentiformis]|uniref:Uncharacterized protein n=1 Tax=Actinomadura rudentiformis TaxID=359158 RepID=A0A6H9Z2L1_9ACTN|nr:hypothetical protein F8566_00780 [Actinomadura rudentiformis]